MNKVYEIIKPCKIKNKEYKKGDIVNINEVGTFYPSVMKMATNQTSVLSEPDVETDDNTPNKSRNNKRLLAYAKEHNIDLGDASKKDEYLAAIEKGEIIDTNESSDEALPDEGTED